MIKNCKLTFKVLKKKIIHKSVILFKIIFNDLYIGNLEILKINNFHKHCEISYLIGEKKFWGMGIGTKVIRFAVKYAKNNLKMKKIIAGTFSTNKASIGVLTKNGFKREGIIKNFYLHNSKKRIHHLWFGKDL
jgi:ribosomal-protein-alanine N-acetyltransferase